MKTRATREEIDAVIAWARSNKPIRPGPRNGHTTLADEVEAMREELRQWQAGERMWKIPGCQCGPEIGDSPCPAHPLNPKTELPYEQVELAATLARVEAIGERWRDDVQVWTAADYDRQVANALRGDQ